MPLIDLNGLTFSKVDAGNRIEYQLLNSQLPPECTHTDTNQIVISKATPPDVVNVTYQYCSHVTDHPDWSDFVADIDSAIAVTSGAPLPQEGNQVEYYAQLLTEAVTMTNVPSADTELSNQVSRRQLDLRNAVNFTAMMSVSVVPAATTGKFVIQYSVNSGSSWVDFYDFGTSYTVNQLKIGTTTAVPAAAKIETCLLRVISRGGNGTADPSVRHVGLMIKPA